MEQISKSIQEVRQSWEKMFSSIDKYYPYAKQKETDEPTWHFIVPERKAWTFDILNRIWCNIDGAKNWLSEPIHPSFRTGTSRYYGFRDTEQNKEYHIICKQYLNRNSLVIIRVEDRSQFYTNNS